jgi:hypothetical protein
MKALLFTVVFVVGCAHAPARPHGPTVSPIRFANAEAVWAVDDRQPVAAPPAERPDVARLAGFDIQIGRRLDRLIADAPKQRAIGPNSLGGVPTSTWFDNRVGVRDVGVDEIVHGPGDNQGPDLSSPLRVVRGKSIGFTAGFVAEDAAGVRWLIKFERTTRSAQIATDIAVQRLLWLIGYKVPENHVATIDRDDAVIGDDATIKDARGRKRPMTDADLDATFARAIADDAGRFPILASRLLDGKPLGSTPPIGVRADDPNDLIPHEQRRELRGLQVFAAWLQHTDFKEMGTLDVFEDDAVVHYLLDFGNSLGQFGQELPGDGHIETWVDADHLRSFFSLGLWKAPWEGTHESGIAGVGAFDAEHFDPGGFTPFAPYTPFLEADATDAFWAVEILLRITPAQIRTALEVAQYQDPRAVDYVTDVLVARQKKSARYWLDRVSPLSAFTVETDADGAAQLCFDDLVVTHDLAPGGVPRGYRASVYDWSAASLGTVAITGTGGRRCTRALPHGADHDGYTIVRLDVDVGDRALPAVEVHLARGPSGMRVIGIERRLPGDS